MTGALIALLVLGFIMTEESMRKDGMASPMLGALFVVIATALAGAGTEALMVYAKNMLEAGQ